MVTLSRWSPLVLVVPAIVAAYFVGRGMRTAPSIEYRDREVIKYRDHEQTNVKVATVTGPTERVVYRDRTVTVPGGTVTVERWREVDKAAAVTTKAEEQTVLIREVDKVRDVVRIETRASQWSVSLMPGLSLREPAIALPGAPRVVMGVVVERHILGPLSAGVWLSTVGAAGITIGARW